MGFHIGDGPDPAQVGVRVTATHPVDGLTGTGLARVTVLNVPPAITSSGVFDAAGRAIGIDVPFVVRGRRVTVRTTFTDPGRLDHQGASVNWADGSVDNVFDLFSDAFGGVQGHLEHGHVYTGTGVYNVAVDVTDDDLDATRAVTSVTAVSPSQAVASIISQLDALIATSTSPRILKLLRQARKALAGDVTGFGEDGALHKLQQQQTAAARARLQNALSDLRRAGEEGADVALLIALIEEVIAAIGPFQ